MTSRLRRIVMVVCTVGVAAAGTSAQVEMDRILSRVNGKIVTRSDVRQAQLLKLVSEIGSEDATRRALENRLLLLGELARVASLPPATDAELAAHSRAWEARVGGGANKSRLLSQAAMTESDLQNWLRDDLRIQAYLKRQFGAIPEADRGRAIDESLGRLRQRAGLD
jgi:hypothetical protein